MVYKGVKLLAEAIVLVALSSVLHLIRIYTLPQGGSITAGSMIPIFLLALRRGIKIGVLSGLAFGLIVLIEEPFIYHPVQVILDYPIAFGALGLAGFFKKRPLIGVSIGIIGRFISHFISGIVFFASFAPEGMNPALYSAIYNGSYLIVEFIITVIIIYFLLKRKILTIL
ncbi:MAG: energy-coupled thiamine transporter ThiT [Candidatus Bathyarchaeia archaeon]